MVAEEEVFQLVHPLKVTEVPVVVEMVELDLVHPVVQE
mgnify:CR=1 FL=1